MISGSESRKGETTEVLLAVEEAAKFPFSVQERGEYRKQFWEMCQAESRGEKGLYPARVTDGTSLIEPSFLHA